MKKQLILSIFSLLILTGCTSNHTTESSDSNNPSSNSTTSDRDTSNDVNNDSANQVASEEDPIEGNVISFNEQGMRIVIGDILAEEGDYQMVTVDEDSENLDVFFDDKTIFEVHVAKNASSATEGDSSITVKPGTIEDLDTTSAVTVFGNYQGDRFVATKVEIWEFL